MKSLIAEKINNMWQVKVIDTQYVLHQDDVFKIAKEHNLKLDTYLMQFCGDKIVSR